MKKSILALGAFTLLCACVNEPKTQYIEKECPSCNPPDRQLQVVTECTDFQDTQLSGNKYAQCRYCTNKIYENGVDVTNRFVGGVNNQSQGKTPCRKPQNF